MAFAQEHHGSGSLTWDAPHGARELPSVLMAPEVVKTWRLRLLIVTVVAALLSLVFLTQPLGVDHLMRAYLMGYMMCFNFTGGALAFLLVQYVSGGKWGLILRRPLEAMTRTIWLVALGVIPVLFFMPHLYQWAAFTTKAATLDGYHKGLLTNEQHLDIDQKHFMLNPTAAVVQAVVMLGFMLFLIWLLNRWSLSRDRDPQAGTVTSFDKWRVLFENVSGPSIPVYVVLMTAFVITFVKSMDVIWASSVYGLQFLVAQGYAVLALGVLTLILLSRYEPFKTMFRVTEQHDLGKLMFAFTMLNIYLTFAEFLIIWSGNIPDELDWYVHRIAGGWWTICTADVVCHWVIPFCLLLSRDIKRNKVKMLWIAAFMIFARFIDMFWLVEPNFRDAAGNLHLAGNLSVLAYITVPVALVSLWGAVYLTELTRRPMINVNDPHVEELLEPEHAH